MTSSRGSPRFAPGRVLLALAAARKSFTRAFSVGRPVIGRRDSHVRQSVGGKPSLAVQQQSAGDVVSSASRTPPDSPAPDPELMSFYLLRHGQTNFNAIGRIQVGKKNATVVAPVVGVVVEEEEEEECRY